MSYEGTVVLNYRLDRKLGEGGFGTVYLAEHTEIGRKAACKILHREFATRAEVVERFFREAKAVCAIGHRAIIDIENFGYLPAGEPFYLMEFFPGEALAARADRGPITPADLIIVFDAVASALAAAHAKQIIHRDLKPENIMLLEESGRITDVKLLDFGIAKLIGDSDAVRSQSGMSLGTPAFMAPEQALDAKSVDARADVYAFGATVFAAVAGCPPFFGGGGVAGILVRVQTEPPARLRDLVPSATAGLEAALEHCLAKLPDRRPATIGEAWHEIRAALGASGPFTRAAPGEGGLAPTLAPDHPTGLPAPPRAPTPKPVAGPSPATTLGEAAGQASRASPPRSRARLALALGALVIASGALITFAVVSRAPDREATTSPPALATMTATSTDAAADVATPAPPPDASPPVRPLDATVPTPVPIDAPPAVPPSVDAGARPRPHPRPDPVPVKPEPVPVKPEPIPLKPDAAPVCTVASFAAIYDQPAPTEADVRGALARLNRCRSELAPERFGQLQQNLISKL